MSNPTRPGPENAATVPNSVSPPLHSLVRIIPNTAQNQATTSISRQTSALFQSTGRCETDVSWIVPSRSWLDRAAQDQARRHWGDGKGTGEPGGPDRDKVAMRTHKPATQPPDAHRSALFPTTDSRPPTPAQGRRPAPCGSHATQTDRERHRQTQRTVFDCPEVTTRPRVLITAQTSTDATPGHRPGDEWDTGWRPAVPRKQLLPALIPQTTALTTTTLRCRQRRHETASDDLQWTPTVLFNVDNDENRKVATPKADEHAPKTSR